MVADERVVDIELDGENELGESISSHLIVQLTGKSANLFLTDGHRRIIDSLRDTKGEGQLAGDIYAPPERPAGNAVARSEAMSAFDGSISELLDTKDIEKRADQEFNALVRNAKAKVTRDITKHQKLSKALNADTARHGDAARWKHFGDLLLANIATAKREGEVATVIDYFSDELPNVEIEVKNNESITEGAERYFKKYTRARNAAEEIRNRLAVVDGEIERLSRQLEAIETAAVEQDVDTLQLLAGASTAPVGTKREREKITATSAVARSFRSSDGFEILVGKRAKDNDVLTFKVARSLDTWMHAADYPGSHVVVRNPNRKEVPQRTLLEAAQLAAFYSQGKAQPKAAVHYTQKKFVNKPKGAAPGLVSLSSFKTLLVEPVVPEFES